MDNFKNKIDQVNKLWTIQKQKSEKADKILDECEKIEGRMLELLNEAEKLDHTRYLQYLESFKEGKSNE